ncbi:MAG: 4Fe-4S dicluster domain-containing protein [Candidatus Solibacter usitatus]|nr:4Fe-4S dicluster domain-containing protein [Candidatus Solibacter usitatus]
MSRAVLYDSTLCVGCRQCEEACSTRWKLPYNEKIAAEEVISSHKLTAIRTHGERFSRKMCMHCQDPACASVCPVGALHRTAEGPVVYEEDRCMGCRYCMAACAFQVPTYEWDARLPKVRKCDMCADRTRSGGVTRCSEACPAGASLTGGRDELIAEARKRIREKPGEYYPRIYGIEEVGGTAVLMLGAVPFEQLGFSKNVPKQALPALTWNALAHVPDVVVMGSVLMGGVYWISHRREEVAKEEGRP